MANVRYYPTKRIFVTGDDGAGNNYTYSSELVTEIALTYTAYTAELTNGQQAQIGGLVNVELDSIDFADVGWLAEMIKYYQNVSLIVELAEPVYSTTVVSVTPTVISTVNYLHVKNVKAVAGTDYTVKAGEVAKVKFMCSAFAKDITENPVLPGVLYDISVSFASTTATISFKSNKTGYAYAMAIPSEPTVTIPPDLLVSYAGGGDYSVNGVSDIVDDKGSVEITDIETSTDLVLTDVDSTPTADIFICYYNPTDNAFSWSYAVRNV